MKSARAREAELEAYLHRHIPISAAMGVSVRVAAPDIVRLAAPLEPNLNHRSTVFGGSAAAIATLAGWCLLHVNLSGAGHGSRIVIQKATVSYDRPIDDDFEAIASLPADGIWDRFTRTLERRGRARIELAVELRLRDSTVGRFAGVYVVLPTNPGDPENERGNGPGADPAGGSELA